MIPAFRLALISATIAIAGCVPMNTDYAELRQNLAAETPALIAPEPPPLPARLELAEAKRLALANNPDLRAIQARIDSARARFQQAYAAYYPTLSARASARHYAQSPDTYFAGGEVVSGRDEAHETYDAGLTLSWLAFDAFTRDFNALAARYGVDTVQAAHDDAQRLLAKSIAQFYYTALLARKRGQIAEADQTFNHAFLEETRKRFDQGAATRADVLNFQIREDNARISRLLAGNDYQLACILLAELIGHPGADAANLELVEPALESLATPHLAEATSTAIAHRADLTGLMAEIRANEALARARRGLWYPRLSLDSNLVYSNPEMRTSFDDFGLNAGATVTWDIYEGRRRDHLVAEAEADRRAASESLNRRWQAIVSQIRQELQNLASLDARIAIRRDIVTATRTIREDVEKAYKAGQVTLTRLNEAQRDLIVADESLAVDLIQLMLTHENLDAATGTNLLGILPATTPAP